VTTGTRAPTIGISVAIDPGRRLRAGVAYLYVNRSYARAVRAAGGVPLLVPPEADPAEVVRQCRGVVVTGGDDLPGALAGVPAEGARPELPERIAWDRALIDAALAARCPLLAVCYGMQLLNLHLGGTLREEIGGGPVDHGGLGTVRVHEIAIRPDSLLHAALGPSARVSSSHHQAVNAVAPGLRVSATAPDGVVEALELPGSPGTLGVEWHPESDETGPAVYGRFLCAVRERQ
jgi:putative glutamine amidotransferase